MNIFCLYGRPEGLHGDIRQAGCTALAGAGIGTFCHATHPASKYCTSAECGRLGVIVKGVRKVIHLDRSRRSVPGFKTLLGPRHHRQRPAVRPALTPGGCRVRDAVFANSPRNAPGSMRATLTRAGGTI